MKTISRLILTGLLAAGLPFLAASCSSKIGKPLPALELQYLDAKPQNAGKPVLLEFWATWCGPCKTAVPHLNALHRKFKDRGLTVLGVTDEPHDVIRAFQKDTPMEYFLATDPGGRLSASMGVAGIPYAFVVSRTGTILWEGYPLKLPESVLEDALK